MTITEALKELDQQVRSAEYVDSGYVDCVKVEALRVAIEALKEKRRKIEFFREDYIKVFGNKLNTGVVLSIEILKDKIVVTINREWFKEMLLYRSKEDIAVYILNEVNKHLQFVNK